MLPLLALAALFAPQDQDPVELLRAVQRQIDAQAIAAAAEKPLIEPTTGRLPGFLMPAYGQKLRAEGLGALALARRDLTLPVGQGEEPDVHDVLAVYERLAGVSLPAAPDSRLDLGRFENLVSDVHRELVQAIGSGREPERVVPQLRASIDDVRMRSDHLGNLAEKEFDDLRERLARLAKVDAARVHALGASILVASLALAADDGATRLARGQTGAPRGDGVVVGDVLLDRDAAFGRMVVGGPGRNVYDCTQLDVIIDVGGDDEYRGPAGGAGERNRLAVVVDLAGNDRYLCGNDALGSASLGIGVLLDAAGDDQYEAQGRSAGFALAGFGAFVDLAGNDRYVLGDMCAGVAIAGNAIFVDVAGDDRLNAGVESCGVGLPGGLGWFCDALGDDVRRIAHVGKSVIDGASVDVSIALGVGLGAPPLLAPGCGVFIDAAGHDRTEVAGLSCGVGGRGGVGIHFDGAGDDALIAGDLAFGVAYGRGLGLAIDESGDDTRSFGRFACGAASDESVAAAFDGSGDDRGLARAPAFGAAQRLAEACCIDLGGRDSWSLDVDGGAVRIAGLRAVTGASIGVFLDVGGAEDRYEFHGALAPENARTRMFSDGAGETLTKQVFVDR
ncbi:MAG: hypothetical protein HZB39_01970 [Planctomycetes bacterium]|nr:hypothetical protein [Planctomycetota bacterium]